MSQFLAKFSQKFSLFNIFHCTVDVVLLWEIFVVLVTVRKTSVAMDTTKELSRTDEENKWRENESWGAYKEEDDAGATKWSSERDEKEIKTRAMASEEWTEGSTVWKYRATVSSSKQVGI